MAKRKHYKHCNFCGKIVYPGTGKYYYGKLIHKRCYYLKKARRALRK